MSAEVFSLGAKKKLPYPRSPHQQVRSIKTALLVHVRHAGRRLGLERLIQSQMQLLRELSVTDLRKLATELDIATPQQARDAVDRMILELVE